MTLAAAYIFGTAPTLAASYVFEEAGAAAPGDPSNVVSIATGGTTSTTTWDAGSPAGSAADIQIESPVGAGNWTTATGIRTGRSFAHTDQTPYTTYRARVRETSEGLSSAWVLGNSWGTDNTGEAGGEVLSDRIAIIGPTTISLTGNSSATVKLASVISATLSLSGTSSGTSAIVAAILGTTSITGTRSGAVAVRGVMAGLTEITGTSTARLTLQAAVASSTISISGSISGLVTSGRVASIQGTASISGVASGLVKLSGQASPSTVSLSGFSVGSASIVGAIKPADIVLTGTIAATTVSGTVISIVGSIGEITGSAAATVKTNGLSVATIGIQGSASSQVFVKAFAASSISITGQITARLAVDGPPWGSFLKLQTGNEMRSLKQNGSETIGIILVTASEPLVGATGVQNIVVKVSKAGGLLTEVTVTATEIGDGIYLLTLTQQILDTAGELIVSVTATGCVPVSHLYYVEPSIEDRVWSHGFTSKLLTLAKYLGLK